MLAEDMAAAFLKLRGYTILARNVRDGPRELDIVAETGRLIVIAEVKFRADDRFGGFRHAVRASQRGDLERAAVAYLKASNLTGRPVRFDLVGLELREESEIVICHLPGAFRPSGHYRL